MTTAFANAQAKQLFVQACASIENTVEASSEGIITLDEEGVIIYANRGAQTLFGAGIVGIPLRSLLASTVEGLFEAARSREGIATGPLIVVMADGTLLPLRGTVVHSPGRKGGGGTLILGDLRNQISVHRHHDQTEWDSPTSGNQIESGRNRQRRAQKIEYARQIMAGEIASMVAHELNQPLSAIAGYCDACAHDIDHNPDRAKLYLEKLEAQVIRAGETVLQMSKLSKGRKHDLDSVDLPELIAEVIECAKDEENSQGVTIDFVYEPEDIHPVRANRIQIMNVMLNLMSNAVESVRDLETERPRFVSVQIHPFPGLRFLMITVTDSGDGIPADMLSKLFMPFVTTKKGRIGVGLSYCHHVLEWHGGQIWHSRNPPSGAVFHFTLPLFPGHQA